MPKNIPIDGGQPIAAPANWNAQRHGPCGTLNVRMDPGTPNSYARMTSAYRLTPAEQAVAAHGGVLFLSILGEVHPVISLWMQDILGGVVGDGIEIGDGEAIAAAGAENSTQTDLLEVGWKAMLEELDAQAEQRSNSPTIGEPDSAGQVFLDGVFSMKEALAVALEAIGADLQAKRQAPAETFDLPVMTLGAVAAEAQARKALEDAGFDICEGPDKITIAGTVDALERLASGGKPTDTDHYIIGDRLPAQFDMTKEPGDGD